MLPGGLGLRGWGRGMGRVRQIFTFERMVEEEQFS